MRLAAMRCASFDQRQKVKPMSTSDLPSAAQTPGLRCLRCGSAHIVVIREIRAAGTGRSVDARCADCREQSILTRE
jgi:hypothetical protein